MEQWKLSSTVKTNDLLSNNLFHLEFFLMHRSKENAIFTCWCCTAKSSENSRIDETNQSRCSHRKQSSSSSSSSSAGNWSSFLILNEILPVRCSLTKIIEHCLILFINVCVLNCKNDHYEREKTINYLLVFSLMRTLFFFFCSTLSGTSDGNMQWKIGEERGRKRRALVCKMNYSFRE